MNNRLQDKIDQYHSGRMRSKELNAFEKELASDPSLQAESDFQSDIINGLKEYRKTELKSRLDAVDISPAWYEFIQQSTLLKSFGGVAVATLVGTGVFFLAEPKEEEIKATIVIDSPKEMITAFSWNIEPAEIAESFVQTGVKQPVVGLVTPEETTNPVEEKPDALVSSLVIAEKSEAYAPDFNAPAAEEIKDEEAMEISSLDELPESSVASENDPIDVDYESKKTLDIKYKYYDGKLFLSGDFDRAPYEILEINSAGGRRIYVKYLEKFYKVNVTDRLTALPQVYDVNVIKELQLLRQNK